MGWGYNNKCFDTVELAKTDYIAYFKVQPIYHPNYSLLSWKINTLVTPTVTAQGKVTFQLVGEYAGGRLAMNHYFQFDSCTVSTTEPTETSAYEYVPADYLSAAAMFNFAFIGVFSLWYLAKNLGSIIEAVRRF